MSVVGTFILQNFTGLLGVLIALIGVLINSHYKRKATKRYEQEAMERRLRHEARSELQAAMAKQAMDLRRTAAQQKADEWALRKELLRAGTLPASPPPTDFSALDVMPFLDDEEQDRAEEAQEEEDGR